MKFEFTIGPPDAGRRLDRWLVSALGGVPVSLAQRLIRKGKARVNGARAAAGDRLALGDQVVVHHRPQKKTSTISADYSGPPLEILHRDDRFLALDKPAHISCSIDQRPESSVDAWLQKTLAEDIAAGTARPEVCHRLDRGTTGVVIVGLTAASITEFHQALAAPATEKQYLVAVWGTPPDTKFMADTPLARRDHSRREEPKVVAAPAKGQEARTEFTVVASQGDATLLRAWPRTGRTHQIRAHLRILELPVIGDPRYGDSHRDKLHRIEKTTNHQLLHAERFVAPSLDLDVTSPIPPEMSQILKRLDLVDSL